MIPRRISDFFRGRGRDTTRGPSSTTASDDADFAPASRKSRRALCDAIPSFATLPDLSDLPLKTARRALVACGAVLVALAPKVVRVLYITAYLDAFGIPPPNELGAVGAFVSQRAAASAAAAAAATVLTLPNVLAFTPSGVLGAAIFWRFWRRRPCRRRFGTASVFAAAVILATTATMSAQMDAFVFHAASARAFRVRDDCQLVADAYGRRHRGGLATVPASPDDDDPSQLGRYVANTVAGLVGLDCFEAGLGVFRSQSALDAQSGMAAETFAAEWIDFCALVCAVGLALWAARAAWSGLCARLRFRGSVATAATTGRGRD